MKSAGGSGGSRPSLSEHVTVEILDDREDLVSESIDRAVFMKRAAVLGGSLVVGGVAINGLPSPAISAPSPAQDVEIFNFLLVLEYAQRGFYERAVSNDFLSGELRQFASIAAEHEREHVDALNGFLGDDAREEPSLAFGDATEDPDRFAQAALAMEEVTVAAYIGQSGNLTDDAVLKAATIVSVEARHAAWMRDLLGRLPAPSAADAANTEEEAMSALQELGFIG
jgi:hypothetical protein